MQQIGTLFEGDAPPALENDPILVTMRRPRWAINPKPHLLERPPLRSASTTCTLPCGRRYFLSMEKKKGQQSSSQLGWRGVKPTGGSSGSGNNVGLLHEPMQVLLDRVERMRVEMAVKIAEDKEKKQQTLLNEMKDDTVPSSEEESKGQSSEQADTESFLWVNKYAPTTFTQLLSDERSNREVLRAVKGWDPFVFGKDPLPERKHNFSYGRYKDQSDAPKNFLQGKGQTAQNKEASETSLPSIDGENQDKRPTVKVILLSGPPGMGKTTLAHIVAKHAGYRPLEINASDNRNATELKELVSRALESQSVFGDRRPNCVILDEVDGIAEGNSAMNALLSIIEAPLKRQPGKKSTVPLTRPLIMICNDQYAPQLRPLRKIAKVFAFKQTSEDRLMKRLKLITEFEGLRVTAEALRTLCRVTGNDVRSCLNTLQFVALKAKKSLKPGETASRAVLQAINNGLKDEKKDIFEVWNTIYCTPAKNRHKAVVLKQQANQTEKRSLAMKPSEKVMNLVESFGDHQKVFQGIHEHFLGLRYNDPTLTKATLAMDWLEFTDLIERRFPSYVPIAAGAIHLLCQSDVRPTIQLPRQEYNQSMMQKQKEGTLKAFVDSCRMLNSARTMETGALDAVSPLLDILGPSIHGANLDLMSSTDKLKFWSVVKVMASCSLSFIVDSSFFKYRDEPGKSVKYQLEPNLYELVCFGDEGSLPRVQLSNDLMQMVGHEANLEAMRKISARENPFGVPQPETKETNNKSFAIQQNQEEFNKPSDPSVKEKIKTNVEDGPLKKKAKTASVPWFQLSAKQSTKENKRMKKKPPVVFKFQKGFTNAVRRPVYINDLY